MSCVRCVPFSALRDAEALWEARQCIGGLQAIRIARSLLLRIAIDQPTSPIHWSVQSAIQGSKDKRRTQPESEWFSLLTPDWYARCRLFAFCPLRGIVVGEDTASWPLSYTIYFFQGEANLEWGGSKNLLPIWILSTKYQKIQFRTTDFLHKIWN